MRFKYKKMIITASCSVMLLGMIVFSTKKPLDSNAADNLIVVTKDNTTVVSNSSVKAIDTENLDVNSPDAQNTVSSGGIAAENPDNAKGVSILMKNAYPEVNKLVEDYLKARLAVDKDKIGKLVDNIYYAGIEELPQMMKNFEAIKLVDCYTIDGPENDAMMVYARTETKIKGIDTAASSLDGFYVRKDANGDFKIILSPLADEVQKIIDEDITTKFAHEIKNDKKLADFFTKLQNRQAGSEEETDSSKIKDKDKKADKKNKDDSSKTKKSGKSA